MAHRLKYVGPHDEVEIPSLGLTVKQGEFIEVEQEHLDGFVEQKDNWQTARSVAATKEGDK